MSDEKNKKEAEEKKKKDEAFYKYIISGSSVSGHWMPDTEELIKKGFPKKAEPIPAQTCPKCEKVGGVMWLDSACIEGELEFYHLIHTELRHRFRCTHCTEEYPVFELK